ncbi:unnamed protein product [Angiostrongylus costaricensis]|uniref:MAM domain-containing protein n=1 Tax=Angiostrongylus costaricensis TaxID=334426 RepID=A0A0R3PIH9_ANGCS|nr:unnamed protein product [Angiostrongylus costaricensis]
MATILTLSANYRRFESRFGPNFGWFQSCYVTAVSCASSNERPYWCLRKAKSRNTDGGQIVYGYDSHFECELSPVRIPVRPEIWVVSVVLNYSSELRFFKGEALLVFEESQESEYSWRLDGLWVWFSLRVREVAGSNPGSARILDGFSRAMLQQ